jgi:perosamine synthetase
LKERLIKPYISFEEVVDDIKDIFETGIFTKGRYIERFREVIREYTGARYSFLTTSATTALWISLKAVGVKPGDEVLVSDFSFPASANVIEDLGAIPVFADVNLLTFNMLPEELEKKISRKTKAVMFVDVFGNPSGILTIKEICKKNNLILIEDAACAFGSSIEGIKCGNIADITCFSFHPRKLITTGEGGAITTNNPEFARFFEVKLNHGAVPKNDMLDFIEYGYNFRLSELQAALGIKQVEKIDQIVESRQLIKEKYRNCLESLRFELQKCNKKIVHNVQSIVFKIPKSINRNILIDNLKKHDIETTIGTYCLSGTTYYKNKYNNVQQNSHFLEQNSITLPCFHGVNVEHVCNAISSIFINLKENSCQLR